MKTLFYQFLVRVYLLIKLYNSQIIKSLKYFLSINLIKINLFPVNKFDKNQSEQHILKDFFSNW
jgi:hypothetical protein